MKTILSYILITLFAIFVGSQITEGVLLVPYWQSLSANEFYRYYNNFGHQINSFYTILTIIALLIPLFTVAYIKINKSKGINFAIISIAFAFLFLATFYIYFKDTNALFFASALNEIELKKELIIWSYWHWGRVILECISLFFLVLSFAKINKNKT